MKSRHVTHTSRWLTIVLQTSNNFTRSIDPLIMEYSFQHFHSGKSCEPCPFLYGKMVVPLHLPLSATPKRHPCTQIFAMTFKLLVSKYLRTRTYCLHTIANIRKSRRPNNTNRHPSSPHTAPLIPIWSRITYTDHVFVWGRWVSTSVLNIII